MNHESNELFGIIVAFVITVVLVIGFVIVARSRSLIPLTKQIEAVSEQLERMNHTLDEIMQGRVSLEEN